MCWLATQYQFWARLRIDGVVLHGLPMVDAAMVALMYMEKVYPEEPKRMAEWRKMAKALRIPMVEDAKLKAERLAREHAKIEAEFGDDD